jgi:hypothetical protein
MHYSKIKFILNTYKTTFWVRITDSVSALWSIGREPTVRHGFCSNYDAVFQLKNFRALKPSLFYLLLIFLGVLHIRSTEIIIIIIHQLNPTQ